MKQRALDEHGYPIDHSSTRFRKVIQVSAAPTPGLVLELDTRAGARIQARVVGTAWSDERSLFIVSCQYAARSMRPEDYDALLNDPDWQLKHLLDA